MGCILTYKQEVRGSSPRPPTIRFNVLYPFYRTQALACPHGCPHGVRMVGVVRPRSPPSQWTSLPILWNRARCGPGKLLMTVRPFACHDRPIGFRRLRKHLHPPGCPEHPWRRRRHDEPSDVAPLRKHGAAD